MESSTQVLRRLLDERGVKWWQSANTLGCVFTRWYSPLFGDEVCAMENGEEGLVLFDHFVTPEQAVEATLGGDLKAENAKLREQIHWLKQGDILHVLTDQEYIDQCEREHLMQVSIDALDKENAKLRELIADLWEYIHIGTAQDGQSLHDRTRELGIEV